MAQSGRHRLTLEGPRDGPDEERHTGRPGHAGAIGEIDPALGAVVRTTPLTAEGRGITVALNGTVRVTQSSADLIARLTPTPSGPDLVEFPTPVDANPLDIAAAATSGSPRMAAATSLGPPRLVWLPRPPRRSISPTRNGRSLVGMTIGTNGQPWYAES